MNKKGFTLVELMVVIVIIGILAAVAAPKLSDNINSARCNEIPKKMKEITDKLVTQEASLGGYKPYDNLTIVSDLGVSKESNYWEFSVTITNPDANGLGDGFSIIATSKVPIGGIATGETISMDNEGTKVDNTTGDVATNKYMQAWFAN